MQATNDQRGIDHSGIGVADIHVSARFYDQTLAPLGLRPLMRITKAFTPTEDGDDPELGGVGYGVDHPVFWIDVFHPHSVRQHTAFKAFTRSEVESFYAAGQQAGGRDNGAPGLRRAGYPSGYYAAFLLDPDGNNIEAVVRERT